MVMARIFLKNGREERVGCLFRESALLGTVLMLYSRSFSNYGGLTSKGRVL